MVTGHGTSRCHGRHGADLSPLICHLAGGDFSTVKILLEESVDLNDTDSTGRTPLMFASGAGHLEATDFDDFDDFGWRGQVGYGQNRP